MRLVINGNMRETGWSLSVAGDDAWGKLPFVREDQGERTSGLPALLPSEAPGSYVRKG